MGCEVANDVGANHAGEFIRRYSPLGRLLANSFAAIRP